MSIGLVVEGKSAIGAVPVLLRSAGLDVGRALQFPGQPVDCSVSTLVQKVLLPRVRIAVLKPYTRILVVLDRESRPDCPGDFAIRVRQEIISQLAASFGYEGQPAVLVVVANRCLENWLIADPDGLLGHSYIRRSIRTRVGASADERDAIHIINYAYPNGRVYHKTRDAAGLAAKVRVCDPDVRKRSRSLDKLLKEAGLPAI